ncbi:MAG: PAS domain S-box protein [Deltaproteobacteria bacterium]|nr:PAS domain S-box protein [Candidatus Anaeroferrophillus wilburensis]MBN2888376.1 PAS domain S-box protein [Deltaproteobacteria bacterium]
MLLPDQPTSPEIAARLHDILSRHRDDLIGHSLQAVCTRIPAYRQRDQEDVRDSFAQCYHAFLDVLSTGSFVSLEAYISRMVQQRSAEDVRLAVIQGAFLVFCEVAFPVLVEELAGDYRLVVACLNHILTAESQALQLFATKYQDALTGLLQETNTSLSQRNEELRQLSVSLDRRVAETTRELQHSRDFLSEIIDNLNAGLVVVDRQLQIKVFNQVMAKITGIPGDEALGQRVDKLLFSEAGVSFAYCKEQLQAYGMIESLKVQDRESPDGPPRYFRIKMGKWLGKQDDLQGYIILVNDITDREVLLHSLSCYVSPKVAEGVLAAKDPIRLAGSRQLLTVLFADLRSFSFQTKLVDPEQMVELLNAYFSIMVEVVSRYEGTLDKFIGDCVMALFGAPVTIADDAMKAVQCAVDMQAEVNRYSRQQRDAGNPYLYLGIGINRGEALVGNIGSPLRMDYTAIGDTVNLASRLQEFARGGEILVSDAVYQCVKETFQVKSLAPGVIKGVNSRVPIYGIEGYRF